MARKGETETDGGDRREKEATVARVGVWRYIIEEMEQREGERRQELAEKAVTRVLLMCNETLRPGIDNRKDGRAEGMREGEGEGECGCDGVGDG